MVDPEGRRWLVRHENADIVLNSRGTVVPVGFAPPVFWRYARRNGVSAIFADGIDAHLTIGVGRHASVRDALDRVASASEQGEPLPGRIDSRAGGGSDGSLSP